MHDECSVYLGDDYEAAHGEYEGGHRLKSCLKHVV
jgi:hypothetical protein